MLEEYLGQSSHEKIHNLLASVASGDAGRALVALNALFLAGQSPVQVLNATVDYLRDLMVLKAAGQTTELVILTDSQRQAAAQLAASFDVPAIIYAISALEKVGWSVKNTDNPRALLEAVVLRLTLSEHFISIPQILSRLGDTKASGTAAEQGGVKKNSLSDNALFQGAQNGPAPLFSPADGPLTIERIRARWPLILEHLQSKGGGLAAKVGPATPLSFRNGVLTIAFSQADPAAKMYIGICEQPYTRERLQTAFSEILCTPVVLKITAAETHGGSSRPTYKPRGARPSQKEMDEILSDPAVKTLIVGLNARITAIQPESQPEPSDDKHGM
jgi:hypothetical protein